MSFVVHTPTLEAKRIVSRNIVRYRDLFIATVLNIKDDHSFKKWLLDLLA